MAEVESVARANLPPPGSEGSSRRSIEELIAACMSLLYTVRYCAQVGGVGDGSTHPTTPVTCTPHRAPHSPHPALPCFQEPDILPAELECVSAAALSNLENICSRVPSSATTFVPVEASSSSSSSSSSASSSAPSAPSSGIATPSRKRPRDEGPGAAGDGHDRQKAQLLAASPQAMHGGGGGGGGGGRGRAVMSPTYGVGLFQEMAASIALLENEISGSSAAR